MRTFAPLLALAVLAAPVHAQGVWTPPETSDPCDDPRADCEAPAIHDAGSEAGGGEGARAGRKGKGRKGRKGKGRAGKAGKKVRAPLLDAFVQWVAGGGSEPAAGAGGWGRNRSNGTAIVVEGRGPAVAATRKALGAVEPGAELCQVTTAKHGKVRYVLVTREEAPPVGLRATVRAEWTNPDGKPRKRPLKVRVGEDLVRVTSGRRKKKDGPQAAGQDARREARKQERKQARQEARAEDGGAPPAP